MKRKVVATASAAAASSSSSASGMGETGGGDRSAESSSARTSDATEDDEMLREERKSRHKGRGWRFDADIRDGVTVNEDLVVSRYAHHALRPAVQPGFYVLTLEHTSPKISGAGGLAASASASASASGSSSGSGSGSDSGASSGLCSHLTVVQVSENWEELAGQTAASIVGCDVARLLEGNADTVRLLECIRELKRRAEKPPSYQSAANWFEVSMPFIAPDSALHARVERALSSGAEEMVDMNYDRESNFYARWINVTLSVRSPPAAAPGGGGGGGGKSQATTKVSCTLSLTNDPNFFHLSAERMDEMVGPFDSAPNHDVQVVPSPAFLPQALSSGLTSLAPPCDRQSLEALINTAIEHLYRSTRADRIMCYRFAEEDFHGEVVAERLVPGTGFPMMGLHFPAMDIPLFARMLFMRVPVRIIPDVAGHELVPLFPRKVLRRTTEAKEPKEFSPELAECPARAVSGCHTQYLTNMEVKSSCVVPLVVSGSLWGLVSIQHLREKTRLSNWARAQCVAAGLFLCQHLVHAAERDVISCTMRFEEIATLGMGQSGTSVRAFFESCYLSLLQELNASAIAIKCVTEPETLYFYDSNSPHSLVDDDALGLLLDRLALQSLVKDASEGICCINNLMQFADRILEDVTKCSSISGAAFITTHHFSLLIARKEWINTIEWAGQQEGQLEVGKGLAANPEERLNPRARFEMWKETRGGMCRPWSLADRAILRGLRLKTHFICSNKIHLDRAAGMNGSMVE